LVEYYKRRPLGVFMLYVESYVDARDLDKPIIYSLKRYIVPI